MPPENEQGQLLLGCQGWRYPDWRRLPTPEDLAASPEIRPAGVPDDDQDFDADLRAPFYSKQIGQREELKFYARTFNAIEVDSTFYATPRPEWVRAWRDATGSDFRFALKLPRIITHDYGLVRGRKSLADFCEVAAELEDKLAAILVQLPPSFGPEHFDVLARFLPHLPADISFAVEFRDPGWLSERTRDLLAARNVAFMLGPTPWLGTEVCRPYLKEPPAGWIYIRFMGDRDEMAFSHLQIDRDEELDFWAAEIARQTAAGRRVIALADNHYQGYSPGTVRLLARRLGLEPGPYPARQSPDDQMNLF